MYFLIIFLIAITGHREGPWTSTEREFLPTGWIHHLYVLCGQTWRAVAEPSELIFCLACMGHTTAQSNSCQEHCITRRTPCLFCCLGYTSWCWCFCLQAFGTRLPDVGVLAARQKPSDKSFGKHRSLDRSGAGNMSQFSGMPSLEGLEAFHQDNPFLSSAYH